MHRIRSREFLLPANPTVSRLSLHCSRLALVACAALACARHAPSITGGEQPEQPACGTAVACQQIAKSAFDAEMARVGRDCLTAQNQREENSCQQAAESTTARNYAAFSTAVEAIIGDTIWRKANDAWTLYRKRQCDAVFDFYSPGTIAPSARSRCMVEVTRSRMRDLNSLYETPLHH
jgi:uncharacterized protein YecT (DUF1311 family)